MFGGCPILGKWTSIGVLAGLAAVGLAAAGLAAAAGSGASATQNHDRPPAPPTRQTGLSGQLSARTADCVHRIRVKVGQPGQRNSFAGGSTNSGRAGQVRVGGRLVTPPPGRSTVVVVRIPCSASPSLPIGRSRGN